VCGPLARTNGPPCFKRRIRLPHYIVMLTNKTIGFSQQVNICRSPV